MTVAENNTNTEVDTDDITDQNINEPATGLVKVGCDIVPFLSNKGTCPT